MVVDHINTSTTHCIISTKMLLFQNIIGNISTNNSATKGSVFYGIRSMGNGDCFITNNNIGSRNYSNSIQIGGLETGNTNCIFYSVIKHQQIYYFCMCNPPYFDYSEEKNDNPHTVI